ncbi:MAG: hypothetical protein IKQ69_06250 [Oscillospiraceae bacterium]|nr:hypothetical protein [Oscillospiraceae bacterium]
MKREIVSQALNLLDERHITQAAVFDPGAIHQLPERIVQMKTKRIISIALAAALILALGIAAYAAWSIHAARQRELKEDFRIEENQVSSYVEYALPDGQEDGLVLLSAVNDGQEQRAYVNISPVSEEEAAAFPDNARYIWRIEGTEIGGSAAPQLPVEMSLSGVEEIREAVRNYSYDKETQTLTLQCLMDVNFLKKAMKELGTESLPLRIDMIIGESEPRTFGPIAFRLTEEQSRYFDFGHAVYHDEELDRDMEIVGLELTPFSAVWKVNYEGAADFHKPGADQEAYGPWSQLEDKVCMEARIVFADGTEFSTGGALTTPFENGTVNQFCGWGSAIDIDAVERIVLGEQVLWQK